MMNLTFVAPVEYDRNNKKYRKGEYGFFNTDFGEILLAQTDGLICALYFVDKDRTASLEELKKNWKRTEFEHSADLEQQYIDVFSDKSIPLPTMPMLLKGTSFQLQVWKALLEIPSGETVSYNQIAKRIGRPTSSRAVGSAVGANEISLLVPCHRVIMSNGDLGFYRWGIARKVHLINVEQGHPQDGAIGGLFANIA